MLGPLKFAYFYPLFPSASGKRLVKAELAKLKYLALPRHLGNTAREVSRDAARGTLRGDTPTTKNSISVIELKLIACLKNSQLGSDIQVPRMFDGGLKSVI